MLFLALGANVAVALEPVEIRGDRFYSGGRPYFPVTHFLYNQADSSYSHTYFSHEISDSKRQQLYDQMTSNSYNTMYLYTLNEGDYGSRAVTPYANTSSLIGGAFDDAKIQSWRSDLERFIADGVRPVLWLFADDSPKIISASEQELKRYIARMVEAFDDLPIMWVLALEADEYWSKSQTDTYGSYLQSLADQPVGVHQLNGETSFMSAAWVDFAAYQDGFESSPTQLFDRTQQNKTRVGGRPFLVTEYEFNHVTLAQQKGLAAAFAGGAGVGNDAPPGLAAFMESLPDGMESSRSGNVVTLQGSGVTATANLSTLEFSRDPASGSDVPPNPPVIHDP